jgi:hypothetical protein
LREDLEKKPETEEWLKNYYKNNMEKFLKPAQAEVDQIFIPILGDEGEKKARMVLEQVQKRSWDEVASSYQHQALGWLNDEGEGTLGHYSVMLGKNRKEWDVVRAKDGSYVLHVKGYKPEEQREYEEVREDIVYEVLRSRHGEDKSRAQAESILKGGALPSGVSWQETGVFLAGSKQMGALGFRPEFVGPVLHLKAGQWVTSPLRSQGAWYVLKVLSREDLPPFDEQKKQIVKNTAQMSAAYEISALFAEAINEEYERQGRIYRNPDYLAMDQQ